MDEHRHHAVFIRDHPWPILASAFVLTFECAAKTANAVEHWPLDRTGWMVKQADVSLLLVGFLHFLLLLQRDLLHSRFRHADDVRVLVEAIEFFQTGDAFSTSQNVATFNGPGLHLEATIHGHGGELGMGGRDIVGDDLILKCQSVANRSHPRNLSKTRVFSVGIGFQPVRS